MHIQWLGDLCAMDSMENGAKLGWLLDTERKRAFVYRPDEAVQEVENPVVLSAAPVLADFALDLREVW